MDRELLLEIGVEELPASWLPMLTVQLAERLKARLTEEGLPSRTACRGVRDAAPADGLPARVDRSAGGSRRDDHGAAGLGGVRCRRASHERGIGIRAQAGRGFRRPAAQGHPEGPVPGLRAPHPGQGHGRRAARRPGQGAARSASFPAHMRWDAQLDDEKGEFTFGRPIRWLLFLYGGRVVPFTIARQALASSPRVQDVSTGAVTYGHRFLATSGRAGRAIKVRSFDEYRKKLGENFVILARERAPRSHHARTGSAGAAHRRARHAASASAGRSAARGSAGPGRVPVRRERRVPAGVPDAAGRSPHDDADPSPALLPGGVGDGRAAAGVSRGDEHTGGQRARHRDERGARRHGAAPRCAVLLGQRSAGRARGAVVRGSTACCSTRRSGRTRRRSGASNRWRVDWRRTCSPRRPRRTRRRGRRGWRRPISRRTWCASSPNCRA